ncbi:hypothetical protein [Paracnuella aquatica]|uniref:hypothetical protein n=1 Tax=Paracnuella aquatica TaxID=2268757 RepID=UPI000DEED3B6|nr:hypothetical protein [Paracnuella aquatica]RPD50860.1 hypothetical protein DRJ53_05025 [Paracnuella aquatica]
MGKKAFFIGLALTAFCRPGFAQLNPKPDLSQALPVHKISPLPQNFYTQHLSFFCKKEDQLQRRTGLNLFFRLGTKDYVDYLEQKPNANKYQAPR